MNYSEALARLEAMELHGMVLGLDRVVRLLRALGDPQGRFRSVHIAGTNGKGSTAVYLESMLREAGIRTGLYTSPHLNRFPERIRLSGREIAPADVVRYTEAILEILDSEGPGFTPTYFEVTTAMALACFADAEVEVAVVEAGLGGRLDATNILSPECCIITNVGLEHSAYLGTSLAEIAREKGGIIKEGRELITGVREPEALAVLEEICRRAGSRLILLDRDIRADSVRLRGGGGGRVVDYVGETCGWRGLEIPLLGAYQVENALLALGAAELLAQKGIRIPESAVRAGLKAARWPGRMEIVGRDPLLVLDGAHNPHAVRSLVRTLREDLTYDRLVLVLGILEDKEAEAITASLVPLADRLIVTRPAYHRGAAPEKVVRAAGPAARLPEIRETVARAVDRALDLARTGDLVLVTGSLYTVGEARAHLLESREHLPRGS